MKRFSVALSLLTIFFIVSVSWATNKTAISDNVDTIAASIEEGKNVTAFKADAYEPYAFIMKENGELLVHPSLAGESLKEKAPPVYEALAQATPEGIWVQYEWKGKVKNTYAKKAKGLIIGSGY